MAVIKANGYGHGLTDVATVLEDADAFAVASLEEAVQLRESGCGKPVILLEGVFSATELDAVRVHGLQPVVHDQRQLEWLAAQTGPASLDVWLKIDTGMHRLGIAPAQTRAFHARLQDCSCVRRIGLLTHLACADEPAHPRNQVQLAAFDAAVVGLDGECSIANSAALMRLEATRRGWVRPGIMLYGASPLQESIGPDLGLQAAMSLDSELIAVRRIEAGEPVGYGAAWTSERECLIGVVAIGYGDGYPRHAPAGTPVLVNGRQVPLIGRVSMDMITVDLGSVPDAAPGDPVQLWGPRLPIDTVARHAGTIAYELMCQVTGRVARFVD